MSGSFWYHLRRCAGATARFFLLLFAVVGGARAQVASDPELRIGKSYCADCVEWSVDLNWHGDWALDESLAPERWGLSDLPVEVMLDGSRSARLRIPAGAGTPTQRFYRLREIDFGLPALIMSELDVEHREFFNAPLIGQVPDDPPLHLERAQPVYRIRVRAVRTANSDGSQAAVITPEQVADLVQQANAVYWTAGIEFVFNPDVDFETRNLTPLNHDFVVLGDLSEWTDPNVGPPARHADGFAHWTASAALRTSVANERPDAITVIFRWGDKFEYSPAEGHWYLRSATGGFSSWASSYVAMPASMPEKNLLAHEMGHYLQNGHPFVGGIETVAQASSAILTGLRAGLPVSDGLNVLDGDRDWVLDTLPDCHGGIYVDAGFDPGDPDAPPIPIPVVSPADGINHTYHLLPGHRHNIMSYFKHFHALGHRLTPQMIERLRDGLENGLRQRLLGKTNPRAVIELRLEGQASGETIAADFEIVRTRHGQLVTAVRGANNKIQLIAWHVDDLGNITRRGSIVSVGTATELTAVNLGLGIVATAFKSETNTLKVITWQVDPDGNWARLGQAGHALFGIGIDAIIDSISTTRLGIHYMATAVRSGRGDVSLVVWRTKANGEVSRVSVTEVGNYRDVSLNPVGRANQVFSALTTTGGNLRVVAWRLEGNQLIKSSQLDAGGVGDVESAYLDVDLNSTVVQIPSTADLKVINWGVSETGVLTRLGDHTHTDVNPRERAFSASRLGVDFLGVAQVNPRNVLEIGAWWTKDAGVTIYDAANATSITALQVQTEQVGRGKFAVAARTMAGELDLRIWKVRKLIPIP